MAKELLRQAKKVLSGKSGRLEDQELEFLAQKITKLGFKLGFARAYAAGPSLMAELVDEIERKDAQLREIRAIIERR